MPKHNRFIQSESRMSFSWQQCVPGRNVIRLDTSCIQRLLDGLVHRNRNARGTKFSSCLSVCTALITALPEHPCSVQAQKRGYRARNDASGGASHLGTLRKASRVRLSAVARVNCAPGPLCTRTTQPEHATFLFHANIYLSHSESCLSLNSVHFPISFVVLQIMGYKELMAEYKSNHFTERIRVLCGGASQRKVIS